MNKSALKTFATNARKELLKKVEAKAMKLGITEETIKKVDIESSDAVFIDGRQLSKEEKIQRDKLIARIKQIGFKQVMEEVAYTWFNRFTALRFMEVNDYLPTGVRVLSSSNSNSADPDMLNEALELDLEINKEHVYELKLNNKTEELFKYLIIKHCNDLNKYLPFMFEMIDDYTEILFPEGLLSKDSFIRRMTDNDFILEETWLKVEVIGWLYQYYISEEKDRVFADLKKNIKITKETLPAATQLFTPNWVVRYMVENSLGRIWDESYPESDLKLDWKYYLDETEQETDVIDQFEKIFSEKEKVSPEEITFLDPSCGSGHILVYAFDLLFEMYLEKGYIKHEIPKLILEKNLFGLDIDDRAVQLASFAVMMKAREKSRRVFDQNIRLNICAIQESNWMTEEIVNMLVDESLNGEQQKEQKEVGNYLKQTFLDAKEYGSIINVKPTEMDFLNKRLESLPNETTNLFDNLLGIDILDKLPALILQTKIMSGKYDVVCTNPPYMGNGGMGKTLKAYIEKHYKNYKSDLYAVFIKRCLDYTKKNQFCSMVTMQSWMSLSAFSNLREFIINNKCIVNLCHMGDMVLGIAYETSATVFRNLSSKNYAAKYVYVEMSDMNEENVPVEFPVSPKELYLAKLKSFETVVGKPISYSMSEKSLEAYSKSELLGTCLVTREGLTTGSNDTFLRLWFEVDLNRIAFSNEKSLRWYPYNKGGEYKKWYGNQNHVVNWENDGEAIKNFKDEKTGRVRSHNYNGEYGFREGITWSAFSSRGATFRYSPEGFLFDSKGSMGFSNKKEIYYILGFLNTNVAKLFLDFIAGAKDKKPGHIVSLPYIFNEEYLSEIEEVVRKCIDITRLDWDSTETSWGFSKHAILDHKGTSNKLEEALKKWQVFCEEQIEQLQKREEELNKIFIDIYDLHNEMEPSVKKEDVTLRRSNREIDIKSFISYSVGCILGRYSLDEEGLVYAGGEFDMLRYKAFEVDRDNILPILPGAYLEDDIVSRFIDFIKVTFGKETLIENLEFIAESLGQKKGETAKETIRRYFLNGFFKDHVQTYKKRPIYWLFTSGKQKAFNCLIYMHRYDKTTLSRIRTDYLHGYQIRLDAEKKDLLSIIEGNYSTKEISNAKKELKVLEKKIEELKEYDELLHHMADMQIEIDLDEGVAVNYEKLKGLVAKI